MRVEECLLPLPSCWLGAASAGAGKAFELGLVFWFTPSANICLVSPSQESPLLPFFRRKAIPSPCDSSSPTSCHSHPQTQQTPPE